MSRHLRISDKLTLPVDAVTQTFAILAKRRAGKSFTARRFAEELLMAGQQVVILDPKGDWWGIRSSSDGKTPGLPVIILGGEHGDLPLEAGAAEVVATLVVEERANILLDVSDLRKKEVARFMGGAPDGGLGFLEAFYRLKSREKFRTPVMLIVDEADAIAPQKPFPGEERMLGAIEDIVRRGGQRGIGCTLVTQRSAVLNKNVLTQTQALVAMRTIAPQDLEAMKAWVDVHGTREEQKILMESLPSLPTGDAWFWSPGWPGEKGIFQRVHVDRIRTFDSGATPEPGKKRVVPKNLADIDLAVLQRQMADTIEKSKAEDPKELRKQIAERDKQIKALQQHTPTAAKAEPIDTKAIVKQVTEEVTKQVTAKAHEFHAKRNSGIISILQKAVDPLQRAIEQLSQNGFVPPEVRISALAGKSPTIATQHRTPPPARTPREGAGQNLPQGEKATLIVAAQIGTATREQVGILTGYKRSSRDAFISRLVTKGFLDVSGGQISATDAGLEALGSDYEPLPTGDALREYWLNRLPEGESKVLRILIERYPGPVGREEFDELTGYKRSSRDAFISRLATRKLVVSERRGGVSAAEHLF